MNKWVLLEHKVYFPNSVEIHYDFLVENGTPVEFGQVLMRVKQS